MSEPDPETVELCCWLLEFRAQGLSTSAKSVKSETLMDAAAALRTFLIEKKP